MNKSVAEIRSSKLSNGSYEMINMGCRVGIATKIKGGFLYKSNAGQEFTARTMKELKEFLDA